MSEIAPQVARPKLTLAPKVREAMVQRLGLVVPSAPSVEETAVIEKRRRDRADLAALRDLIAEAYPRCFAPPRGGGLVVVRPLKIGIYHDLVAADLFDKAPLRRFLIEYCSSGIYLAAMVAGADRIDLDGEPAGVVSEDAASIAAKRLFERVARRAA